MVQAVFCDVIDEGPGGEKHQSLVIFLGHPVIADFAEDFGGFGK